jgi:hypothetical protein
VSSDDKYVNNLRIQILDQEWIRRIFTFLRDYYRGKNYDLDPILNLLEANLLNANAQLEVFRRLFEEVLKRNAIREEVLTEIHNETHKTDKEFKEFKDKGVHEIIKEYLGGID